MDTLGITRKKSLWRRLRRWSAKREQEKEIAEWENAGKPVPIPHIIKQRTLQGYAREFGLKILVETGTYLGEMVDALQDDFDRLYSIELSRELYEKARKKFKGFRHIELICGDSGHELGNLMKKLDQPALFWLDGHYSSGETAKGDKDTPIYEELQHILNFPGQGHVIVIDDARCFGNAPDYPGIEELSDFVRSRWPEVNIVAQDDSIRITPVRKSQ